MAAMSIELPEGLRSRVEARARESGFDSVEAYVRAVLLADAAGGPVVEDEALETLLASRQEGPFVDADAEDFARMRRKLAARLDPGVPEPGPGGPAGSKP